MSDRRIVARRPLPVVAAVFNDLFEDVPPPLLLLAAMYGLHMLGSANRNTRALMMLYLAIFVATIAGGVVALELHEWAHAADAEAAEPEEVVMAEITELLDNDDVDSVD
jgi:thiol:disulfide interchange protein